MKPRSACRCLLCQLEFHLKKQLHEVAFQENYSKVACSSFRLSGFPNAFALAAHLRTCRSNGGGTHPADAILLELLHLRQRYANDVLLRDVLLLAFVPVLHSASRRIARLYPSLVADDIAQNLVVSFLEALGSPGLLSRTSHLAFAISRMVKRNIFAWAECEIRRPDNANCDGDLTELVTGSALHESFERAVLLRHFLFRCQREGLLTGPDLELLVHIKLEGGFGDANGTSRGYSNALRQKIKRLLRKLRKEARTPCTNVDNPERKERT